jgi:hypothetical protein
MMQITSRIAAVRCRAERLNRTLAWCCSKTGVHYSTIRGWELGHHEPNLRSIRKLLEPIERFLDREEAEMRAALNGEAEPREPAA